MYYPILQTSCRLHYFYANFYHFYFTCEEKTSLSKSLIKYFNICKFSTPTRIILMIMMKKKLLLIVFVNLTISIVIQTNLIELYIKNLKYNKKGKNRCDKAITFLISQTIKE